MPSKSCAEGVKFARVEYVLFTFVIVGFPMSVTRITIAFRFDLVLLIYSCCRDITPFKVILIRWFSLSFRSAKPSAVLLTVNALKFN